MELSARNLSIVPIINNSSRENSPFVWVFTIALFIFAGIAEIGGGYLIWKGIREKTFPAVFLPLGSLILVAYGFIPTLQPKSEFGRIYAVYGGFFIGLSIVWGYIFDGFIPDKGDCIGGGIALVGVLIAWFWPR